MADVKVVEWSIRQLQRKQGRPFFQAVGIFRPHVPWYAPQRYFDLYPLRSVFLPPVRENDLDDCSPVGRSFARRSWHRWIVENNQWARAVQGYLACISFADARVGQLLDALDASPHAKNTIVVLWSDHGMHIGEKENWEKFTLWEESTRVPLMIVAPGVTRAGGRCAEAVSLLDVYPTLVELCGLPPNDDLEGVSLVPQLRDPKTPKPRPAITTWHRNNHSVRTEQWRYIRYHDGSEELYDRDADPDEFTNLAGDPGYASVKKELAAWLPTINVENDPAGRRDWLTLKKLPTERDSPGPLKQGDYLTGDSSPKIAGASVTFTARIAAERPAGVIVAQGGDVNGYAVYVNDGRLTMTVRRGRKSTTATAESKLPGQCVVTAKLGTDGTIELVVDGRQVAAGKAPGSVPVTPGEGISVGSDEGTQVGDYEGVCSFDGRIDELRIVVGK